MKKAIAIGAFLLAGCGDSPNLAIQSTFTSGEVELINKAIEEWYYATDSDEAMIFTRTGYVDDGGFSYWDDWIDGPTDFAVIYKSDTQSAGYKTMKSILFDGRDFNGATNVGRRIVMIRDNLPDDAAFYQTMLHELGHFYGIPHQSSGLMFHSAQVMCIDTIALEEFCFRHQCGPNAQETCSSGNGG